MQFNHDNMTGPLLAADLVNATSIGWQVDHVSEVLKSHQIRRSALSPDAAGHLHEWAIQLWPVFNALSTGERCETINALLDAAATRTYLSTHDGLRPHLHFASDQDDVVARVKAVTAGGLAIFVVESEGTRLGVCQRHDCSVAFVDTSRNGRRRFCSATCGNYEAVRRHRGARSPRD